MRPIDADILLEKFEEQNEYLEKLSPLENPSKTGRIAQLSWCINTIVSMLETEESEDNMEQIK